MHYNCTRYPSWAQVQKDIGLRFSVSNLSKYVTKLYNFSDNIQSSTYFFLFLFFLSYETFKNQNPLNQTINFSFQNLVNRSFQPIKAHLL
jgi:hypothetical protein